MLSIQLQSFTDTRNHLWSAIASAPRVKTERWQGADVSKNPAAVTYELRNVCFEVPLSGIMSLDTWRADCAPNLPWADDHFSERVCGEPLNPGAEWARWPWAGSADKFRENEKFNHTYMERLWPRWARMHRIGSHNTEHPVELNYTKGVRKQPDRNKWVPPRQGICCSYGDLESLVELLSTEPYTRQAWIPLFFPEDTGIADGGRKPCTLGYQILVRKEGDINYAHIYYPLRSCDLQRHFQDDCYMAVRLLIWVIEKCRQRAAFWDTVWPGTYAMHMTSLHIFENDMRKLKDKT